jgi:hypothetical protein
LRGGSPYRRAKDFSPPNRRATDGRRIPPLLELTIPLRAIAAVGAIIDIERPMVWNRPSVLAYTVMLHLR